MSNAIKFSRTSTPVICKVTCQTQNVNNILLVFSVRDEGIGIPKDRIERMFDMFTQADSSTTRKYGGSGLGLNISQRMVHAWGGTISIDSEVNAYSIFTFTLPTTAVEQKNDQLMIPLKSMECKKMLRVLVAEDNYVNQVNHSVTLFL